MSTTSKRHFGLLWVGQFISSAGDYMFYAVLLFLVLTVETQHGGTKAGVVSFLETLPFLLFGPFVGAVVDRVPKRWAMIGSDLARMIVLLAFWPFYWIGELHWWSIGALAFFHTTFSTFFMPARDAFLPLLAKSWLFRANALIQSSTQLAMVTGAFAAGILVGRNASVARMLMVLTVDALTFLVSIATLLAIRVDEVPQGREERQSLWRESLEGFWYARRDPFLWRLLILTAVDNLFIMGPAIVGANLLVKRVFALGPSDLAFFQGSMALGWLAGTLFLYFRKPKDAWHILVWGIVLDGATYLPFLWIRWFPLALVAILFHGFFIPWITVSRTTLIQETAHRDYLGRVFALVHLTVLGFTSLSSFLTGVMGDLLPVPYIFFWPGVMGTLTGILAFRVLPRPQPDVEAG